MMVGVHATCSRSSKLNHMRITATSSCSGSVGPHCQKNPSRLRAAERYLSTLSKTLSRRYLSSLAEMFPLRAFPDDFPASFPGFQPMALLQKPIPPASPACPFLPCIASCLGGRIWIIRAFPEKGIGAVHSIHHLHCRY